MLCVNYFVYIYTIVNQNTYTMKTILENRTYKVFVQEGIHTSTHLVTFKELFTDYDNANEDAFEFIYALQEDSEKVLGLQVGDSLFFDPIRDLKGNKGIIVRIS